MGTMETRPDPINRPTHYTSHPSGVECITITRHMSFNLGNALKYIWRADLKNNAVEDLKKAIFYLQDEIAKRGPAVQPSALNRDPNEYLRYKYGEYTAVDRFAKFDKQVHDHSRERDRHWSNG